uniref:Uncharacterized protein n=1 Tax=Romanomermis culicivorax TaxID=13658 RepID=A0A915I3G5_ROMCU
MTNKASSLTSRRSASACTKDFVALRAPLLERLPTGAVTAATTAASALGRSEGGGGGFLITKVVKRWRGSTAVT